MKHTHRAHPALSLRLLTALPFLCLTGVASGQGAPPSPAQPGAPVLPPLPHAAAEARPEKPLSLNFPGGSVREFIAAVEEASGEPFNVVIPEAAEDVRIPAVNVREVTLTPLLSALSQTSRERKAVIANHQASIINVEYEETGYTFIAMPETEGNKVWQLQVQRPTRLPEAPPPPRVARFYSLRPILEAGAKLEDITTVIQTAWELMRLDPKDVPEMKFHEETGILVATGPDLALGVITNVMSCLPASAPAGPAVAPAGAPKVRTVLPGEGVPSGH